MKRIQWLISGNDARDYLQGQLTADIAALADGSWTPAAHCTPQGKTLAVLLAIRLAEGYLLLGHPDTADALEKRLKMFTLHKAVQIERAAFSLTASGGSICTAVLENGVLNLGGIDSITPAGWIAAGLADIGCGLQDQYLPQALGLEANNGISYQKGCYIGQEAIARAHYKGGVNRHLHRIIGAGTLSIGAQLSKDGHNAATVLLAAENQALAVIQDRFASAILSAADGGQWQVQA